MTQTNETTGTTAADAAEQQRVEAIVEGVKAKARASKAAKPTKAQKRAATKGKPAKKVKPRRRAEDDEDGEEDEGKSVVPAKYKQRYGKEQHNGDDIAIRLRKHLVGADGKVDEKKMVAFFRANECWKPEWVKLNLGQRRMLGGIMLRTRVRKGHKVVWK